MNIACSRWPGSRERMSERVSASQVRRFVGVGGRAPEIQARWWAICRRHRCNLRRNGRPLLALDDDEAESPLYAPRPANSSQLLKFNHTTFSLIHHTLPTHSFIHSFFLHQLVDAVRCRPPAIVQDRSLRFHALHQTRCRPSSCQVQYSTLCKCYPSGVDQS